MAHRRRAVVQQKVSITVTVKREEVWHMVKIYSKAAEVVKLYKEKVQIKDGQCIVIEHLVSSCRFYIM